MLEVDSGRDLRVISFTYLYILAQNNRKDVISYTDIVMIHTSTFYFPRYLTARVYALTTVHRNDNEAHSMVCVDKRHIGIVLIYVSARLSADTWLRTLRYVRADLGKVND